MNFGMPGGEEDGPGGCGCLMVLGLAGFASCARPMLESFLMMLDRRTHWTLALRGTGACSMGGSSKQRSLRFKDGGRASYSGSTVRTVTTSELVFGDSPLNRVLLSL